MRNVQWKFGFSICAHKNLLHFNGLVVIIIKYTVTCYIVIRNAEATLFKIKSHFISSLEFGMYPQSMPTEWTHARTVRPWQSVRLDL